MVNKINNKSEKYVFEVFLSTVEGFRIDERKQ